MRETSAAFDGLMAAFDTAMTVVTTASGGERAGCLAAFQSQSSMVPPRYAIWISKAKRTFHVAVHADHVAVHLLSEDDHDVAELFGSITGDDDDKFRRCDWRDHAVGVPVLERCPNHFVARRVAMLHDGGDHVCLVAEPVDAACTMPFRPLRLSASRDVRPGYQSHERPWAPFADGGGSGSE